VIVAVHDRLEAEASAAEREAGAVTGAFEETD
jgi:hypothetical protein